MIEDTYGMDDVDGGSGVQIPGCKGKPKTCKEKPKFCNWKP